MKEEPLQRPAARSVVAIALLGVLLSYFSATPAAAAAPVPCAPAYPIARVPLFDLDVNCGFNASIGGNWTSKTGNLSSFRTGLAAAASITSDAPHGMQYLTLASGAKITVPFNIGPSAHPNITLEYLGYATSVTTNSIKALFSSNPPSANSRSLLVYDPSGSGSYFVPVCSATILYGRMPLANSLVHIALAYNSTGGVTLYVNGLFSQAFSSCGIVDGAPNFTLNGVYGTSTYDVAGQRVYYVRAWGATLNATEVLALALTQTSGTNLISASAPVWSAAPPFAAMNSVVGGTASFSSSVTIVGGVVAGAVDLLLRSGGQGGYTRVTNFTTSSQTAAYGSNGTYRFSYCLSLYPSLSYVSYFAGSYDTFSALIAAMPIGSTAMYPQPSLNTLSVACINASTQVWIGTTPLTAAAITAPCTNLASDGLGSPVAVCVNVTFNRPVNWTAAGGPGVIGLPTTAFTGLSITNPGITYGLAGGSGAVSTVCFNVIPAWPPTAASLQFSGGPTTMLVDLSGVPLFGGERGCVALGCFITGVPREMCVFADRGARWC